MNRDLIDVLMEARSGIVLDGGLATELEREGFDLDDPLWSARALMEEPDAIRDIHLDYLDAGADCITTASYQASIPGFLDMGMREHSAHELILRAVDLAVEARAEFLEAEREAERADLDDEGAEDRDEDGDGSGGDGSFPGAPWIAASVGPYGAYRADGSEYTGRYGVPRVTLSEFHWERLALLAASPADLLAMETIPSADETDVLLRQIQEIPGAYGWISFSCKDGAHLCDGTPLVEVARRCDINPRIAAVGVNCTAPNFVSPLIAELRRATRKPIIVYPNSGETYCCEERVWVGEPTQISWGDAANRWLDEGATVVGGCCRVGVDEIAEIRAAFDRRRL